MEFKYFSITYNMRKLSDNEKQVVFDEAKKSFANGKAITAGWVNATQEEDTSTYDGWFAVDDELPSQEGFYLIFDELLGVSITRYYPNFTYNNKILEENFFDGFENVTHWAYVPNPPKG